VHAFDIFGDGVRWRILELLASGEQTAGAITTVIRAVRFRSQGEYRGRVRGWGASKGTSNVMQSISTRTLLSLGIAGATIFPLLTAVQAFTREGFRLAAHPLSLLSVGAFGWIQVVNFILSGLLFFLFAVDVRRVLSPASFWIPLLFKTYGLLTILGGIFVTDPMLGFPPGTPDGLPATLSWHATAHNLIFFVVFFCIVAIELLFIGRFAKEKKRGWFTYSLLTALAAPALIVAAGEPGSMYYGAVLFSLNLITNAWIVAIALWLTGIGTTGPGGRSRSWSATPSTP
jgi:hypothetical protein